ncbi:response regulator [Cellulomonas rhizosphaerae]|uniref:DNA-binding response regulator n=1 Tax=Cellulomonas rhizosphaerae TaxID=2293719 RepID=A0A413RLV9_9CELL|nr:response regulator transcription factor [Cellulomonas rhizosphaerae]RHA41017.1 DNA-binding response regulator [Cellulomonas rhizosphaerae]
MISVVVVDDEALFREGLVELLGAADDIDVAGQGANGREGVDAVLAHRPDVVLLDMQMPVMNGLEAMAEIRRSAPHVAVIVLTSFQYDEYILPALRDGAAGYLLKDSSTDELRRAVRVAAAGDAILSPAVTRQLLDALGGRLPQPGPSVTDAVDALSERERDVLGCVTAGMSNTQVARRLYMSETTAKSHLAHAMAKLGAANRTQAAIIGFQAGLEPPS